jgi:hypothetical protein
LDHFWVSTNSLYGPTVNWVSVPSTETNGYYAPTVASPPLTACRFVESNGVYVLTVVSTYPLTAPTFTETNAFYAAIIPPVGRVQVLIL